MRFNRSAYVPMAPEDGGDGGAASAPAAAPAAAAPAPAAASPAPAPSVMAGGAPAPGAAPAAAAAALDPVFGAIPEKFRVKNEDGSANLSASWDKVEQHRSHLEKRLGAGDIPPAAATDYKINVPEALASKFKAEDLAKDASLTGFLAEAHAAGMTQKQVDLAINGYLTRVEGLGVAMAQISADDCTAALKAEWKTDDVFKAQTQAAYRASSTYGDVDKLMAKYGNDPDFIRFAAKVGAELGEDTGASTQARGPATSDAEVESLQKSPAYWNAADPQHATVKAKVDAHYTAKYGDKPKASGSMAFGHVL